MRASLEAGLAFSNASLGAVHAMAHSLGGYIDLPHGICNSVLLEHVIEYNSINAESRYSEIARIAGCESEKASSENLVKMIIQLKKEVGITSTLKDLGVNESDLPILSGNALKDICMVTNPRQPSPEEMQSIFRKAL